MTTLKMNGNGQSIILPEKQYPKNEASSRNLSKQVSSNSTRKQSTCTLTSRKGAQKVSAAACITCDEHVSSAVVSDGSFKKLEGSNFNKCLDCNPSEQHKSAKSDISSEVELPLAGDKNELNTRRALEKNLNSSENGLSSITHDTQTDSSCSNSYVTHPVYSSRENCPGTSTEGKTFMQQNFNSSASAPITFISCMEDPVTSRLASGMAGQTAQNAVSNGKVSANIEVLGVIKDQNSSSYNTLHLSTCSPRLWKNLDAANDIRTDIRLNHGQGARNNAIREIREHLGSRPDKVCGGVDCSGNHIENDCSAGTNKEIHSCTQSDSSDPFCPKREQDVMHRQSSAGENRSSFTSHQESEEKNTTKSLKFNDGLKSLTKCEIEQETAVVSKLNLNEDIRQLGDQKQSDEESIPSIKVIRVVAKCGVPLPLSMDMSSLTFEGELGWRGAASTSAFRPASFHKSSDLDTSSMHKDDLISNDTERVMEIDLNVAATEDCSSVGFPSENGMTYGASTYKSSANDSSKQAEKFNFDLNLLGDNADGCPESFFPVKAEKFSSFVLNLNEDPCIQGALGGAHQHFQNEELLGKKKIESAACPVFPRDQGLKFVRLGTGGNMHSVHNFSHALGQPFLVANPNMQHRVEHIQRMVPLQSRLPYVVQMLPPHSYPSNGPFYIGPASSVPSSNYYANIVPYTRQTHDGVIFPQVLNSSAVSAFPGAPYLVNVPQGQNQVGVVKTRTRFDVDNGEHYMMNGFKKDTARQFFPIESPEEQMQVHQQPHFRTMPIKRREPEGGCEAFQSGYKHTTSSR